MSEHLLRIREAHKAMGDLLRGIDWSLFDTCDCGHRRVEHRDGAAGDGREPCARRGCLCKDFDDFGDHQNPLRAA